MSPAAQWVVRRLVIAPAVVLLALLLWVAVPLWVVATCLLYTSPSPRD